MRRVHSLAHQERRQEIRTAERQLCLAATLNAYARKVIEANGGEVMFEEYIRSTRSSTSATVNRIMSNKVDVVFNTVIPPGVARSSSSSMRRAPRMAAGWPASITTRTR